MRDGRPLTRRCAGEKRSAHGTPDASAGEDLSDGTLGGVNRGEIWTIGSRTDLRYRVLVLSADSYNERSNASPFCAPIVRQRGVTELPPYAVALTEQDPITGVVVINRMRRLPASVGAERIGMVTGASMSRVTDAVRGLFEL